jgi:hypothetical protein
MESGADCGCFEGFAGAGGIERDMPARDGGCRTNSEDVVRRLAWGLTCAQTDPAGVFGGPVGLGLAAVDRPYGAVGSGGVTS